MFKVVVLPGDGNPRLFLTVFVQRGVPHLCAAGRLSSYLLQRCVGNDVIWVCGYEALGSIRSGCAHDTAVC